MSQEKQTFDMVEGDWKSFYRLAGAGVLLSVVFIAVDMVMTPAGADPGVGKMSAVDWFANFNSSWLAGLRNYGMINVINTILTIPLYLALYHLHRKLSPAYGALALVLYLLGAAIYIANNRALSMLDLSEQYGAAVTEAEKSLLVTSGTVLMAQSEDFTPGSFLGFFVSLLGTLSMMLVMLRGRVFSRGFTLAGLVGAGCMMFFTITATFARSIYDLAMIFAGVGGLLLIAWDIYMALGMFRLAGSAGEGAIEPVTALQAASGKGI